MRVNILNRILPLVCLTGSLFFIAAFAAGEESRPNVILVMTDDQGYGDLSFYGNQKLKTPNLDQLADESTRLDNFHVDPTCSPTRSALMTGRYSCRTGVWHTVMGRSFLRRDEKTMADYFAANGYQTGIIGKWHLGDNAPYRPQDRGFHDVFIHGGGGVGQTPDYWGNNYFDDTYFNNGTWENQSGYCTEIFFNQADRFVTQNREKPFFLYLSTNAPHGPYLVDQKYSEPFKDQGLPSPLAEFYGMIVNIDENMGQLRNRLKELGLAQNTLLIFMTDNGTAAGARKPHGYNAGMRGAKGSEYEGGHRVPCFWHWPEGKMNASRTLKSLTAHIDILPTLIELCHLQQKPAAPLPFDGISLAGLLKANSNSVPELEDRTIFVQSHRIEHPKPWRKSTVLWKDWRLVNGKELYHLKSDPSQTVDLAKSRTELHKQLKDKYESWYAEVSRRFDEYCRIPLGTDQENPTLLTAHDWHTEINQIPWNQKKISEDLPGMGQWAVKIEQPGTYRFKLSQRPPGIEHQNPPAKISLKIGDTPPQQRTSEQIWNSVEFSTELKAGDTFMSGWYELPDGTRQGIYYIEAERLK